MPFHWSKRAQGLVEFRQYGSTAYKTSRKRSKRRPFCGCGTLIVVYALLCALCLCYQYLVIHALMSRAIGEDESFLGGPSSRVRSQDPNDNGLNASMDVQALRAQLLGENALLHHGGRLPSDAMKNSQDAAARNYVNRYCPSVGLKSPAQQFVLIRTLANDLPPRHAPNQTAINLQFILDNEPKHYQRYWIINRVVSEETEDTLRHLLDRYNEDYEVIRFVQSDFQQVPLGFDRPGVPIDQFYVSSVSQQRYLLQELYHDRNQYVMHNNQARNRAIEYGSRMAEWVLPFDGATFATAKVWDEFRRESGASKDDEKYMVVPMARILDNQELLPNRSDAIEAQLDASSEPQIAFRCDAQLRFDEKKRYGRSPKVELLKRLGVVGPWDDLNPLPWEGSQGCADGLVSVQDGLLCRSVPEKAMKEKLRTASHIFRLASGLSPVQEKETASEHSSQHGSARHSARLEGIVSFLDTVDSYTSLNHIEQLHGVDRATILRGEVLTYYKEQSLESKDSHRQKIWDLVQEHAEAALQVGILSVRARNESPDSGRICRGDHLDYCSPAPPGGKGGELALKESGSLGGGASIPPYGAPKWGEFGGVGQNNYDTQGSDRARWHALSGNCTLLALAWYRTKDSRFSSKAASLVRNFFIDPALGMRPHLKYSNTKKNREGVIKEIAGGYVDTVSFYHLVCMAKSVRRVGQFYVESG